MKPLVAVFKQMDDIGTINVEITTLEDYTAKEPILYRVPREAVFNSVDLFPIDKLQKKLSDFVKVDESPFAYSIYKDASDVTTLLWRSDPTRLYFSEFFVLDSGIFNVNVENTAQPLIGMGERAGSVFYKD